MYKWFLFEQIDEMIASREVETIVEEVVSEAERYKLDSRQTLFNKGNSPFSLLHRSIFQAKPKTQVPQKHENRLKKHLPAQTIQNPRKVYSLMGK